MRTDGKVHIFTTIFERAMQPRKQQGSPRIEYSVYKTIEDANVFDDIPDSNDEKEENNAGNGVASQVLSLSKIDIKFIE